MDIIYDWDEKKAKANLKKHEVSFKEATTVFSDPNAILGENFYTTDKDKRDVIVGLSEQGNLLFVVYETNNSSTWIRLISAREAKGRLKQEYWAQL